MSTQYEPKDHIQHLDIAPRAEGVLDQREITIQSYQTTVPFDFDALHAGLEAAWLTPQIRFGVFARSPINPRSKESLTVVLGLQDELSLRAYDYDNRRPIWFSWQDLIVDTVSIHYFRDEDGLLRFTTTGGGRRITDDRLHDFNNAFLKIPKDAVSKRYFDLAKLRELCFERFSDRLYMLRFADPSGEEYRSIDHALFQSRRYIDPQAERLHEIQADTLVKIESFDSDIDVRSDLAGPIQVRFFIRGLSGSLRLRFPKISYKSEPKTPEEQTRVFYRLVDVAVSSILDADYYTQQRHSLDELNTELGMFPDLVDLAPFREVLTHADARVQFFSSVDMALGWEHWQPHLRAIDELVVSDVVATHVAELARDMAARDPQMAMRMLAACQNDAKTYRVGDVVASAVADKVQGIPATVRAQVEETLLSWAVAREQDSWDVDLDANEIQVFNLHWRTSDLSLGILPAILWKLIGLLHARLQATNGDIRSLLRQYNWCMDAVKALPPRYSKLPAALRLVVDGHVPHSIPEANKILRERVTNLQALDEAILTQFGLPLWPFMTAYRNSGKVTLENSGVGVAIAVKAAPAGTLFSSSESSASVDLPPGAPIALAISGKPAAIDVQFIKFGKEHRYELPIISVKKASPSSKAVKKTSVSRFDWAKQAEVHRAAQRVLGDDECPDKGTISRAVRDGQIQSNKEDGRKCRVNVDSFTAWITKANRLAQEEVVQIGDAIVNEIRSRKR